MRSAKIVRINRTPDRVAQLVLTVAAALGLAGCARKAADTYQGYIEGKFVYVASPQSGRLDRLLVERGQTAAVGKSLFALDDEPEASENRQAQRILRASQSRLTDLESGKRPQEVDVTQAQLLQALAAKKQAEQIFASEQAQFEAGGIAQTELINAQAAVETSAARVRELGADLAVDALPARQQQVRAQTDQVAADAALQAAAAWKLQQKDISSPRQGLVFDTLYRAGE